MSGHTKGPWSACQDGECRCGQVFAQGNKHVATAHAATEDSNGEIYATWAAEEMRANARLIAAAPDPLKALSELLECFDPETVAADSRTPETMRDFAAWQAEQAIAKAKGEPK